MRINIAKKVGKGYKSFWNFKGRYKVCKGSRASKKSTTTAQWIIYNMMKYPLSNTLVIRQMFNTHLDSTWTQLKWATKNLGVADLWDFKKSPLSATYRPTGQKILFRGLDDPMSITSITVEHGYLCWCWWEEAYQVKSEDAFNKVDMSIRGELPPGYFKQHIVTFNPWSDRHWLKKRFFDVGDEDVLAITTNYLCNEFLGDDDKKVFEKMRDNPWSDRHWLKKRFFDVGDEDVLAITTNYLCNEFLGDDDKKVFEKMRDKNPERYRVEGLGNWGIVDGLVFSNWRVETFQSKDLNGELLLGLDFGFTNDPTAIISSIIDEDNKRLYVFDEFFKKGLLNNQIADILLLGLDFGFTNDPTAIISSIIDEDNKRLYVFDEFFKKGLLNNQIADILIKKGYSKSIIIADSAEQKSIEEIRRCGVRRIKEAVKGQGSVLQGIQKLQQYEIIIHPSCINLIEEFENYSWAQDKDGTGINKPVDMFNHGIDALRYSLQCVERRPKLRTLERGSF